MNLWIVDDDVSFAYRLKQNLAPLLKRYCPSSDVRMSVYHDERTFVDAIEQARKIQAKSPQLIFLEVQMGQGRGLQILGDLVSRGDTIVDVIHVLSSMGYGRYQGYFQSLQLEAPPFVQKSQMGHQLETILKGLALDRQGPRDKGGLAVRIPLPLARQAALALEELLKIVRDDYYARGLSVLSEEQYLDDLTEIFELADDLGQDSLADSADRLLADLEKKKGANSMKSRGGLKEFLNQGEKTLEVLKHFR